MVAKRQELKMKNKWIIFIEICSHTPSGFVELSALVDCSGGVELSMVSFVDEFSVLFDCSGGVELSVFSFGDEFSYFLLKNLRFWKKNLCFIALLLVLEQCQRVLKCRK